jgi:hypothetical protein
LSSRTASDRESATGTESCDRSQRILAERSSSDQEVCTVVCSACCSGLVEESDWRPDPQLDDERRRYYRIIPFGTRVVKAEAKRLAAAVTAARARRLLPKDFGR